MTFGNATIPKRVQVPPTELRWGQAVASAAAASAASAAAAAAALKGGVGGVAVTLRPPQTQDLLLSPGGQLLVSPAKPHLARVTTSSLDCAYRRCAQSHTARNPQPAPHSSLRPPQTLARGFSYYADIPRAGA